MVQVTIERAKLDDLSQFTEMEQEAEASRFITPYSLEQHQNEFSEPHVIYLRITNDDVLVGFFILELDGDRRSVEFRRIVVSGKGKEKRIGQAAIRQMGVFCRDELRRSRIWLDVLEHNQRGRHVYEKLGYKRYGKSDFKRKPLLLYEKRLCQSR